MSGSGMPSIRRRAVSSVSGGAVSTAGQDAAADVFAGFADAARSFGDLARKKSQEAGSEQALADFAAISGDNPDAPVVLPSRRTRIFGLQAKSFKDEAYDQMAQKLMVDRAVNNADSTFSELEKTYELDPQKAQDAMTQARDEIVGQLPYETAQVVQIALDARIDSAVGRRRVARIDADQKEALQAHSTAINNVQGEMSKYVDVHGIAGMEDAEYERMVEELGAHIETAVNNPMYGWSEEQGDAFFQATMEKVLSTALGTEAAMTAEQVFSERGAVAARQAMDQLEEDYGGMAGGDAIRGAVQRGRAWISEQETYRKQAEADIKRRENERQSTNYFTQVRKITEGVGSLEEVQSLFMSGDIDDGQYTDLHTKLFSRTSREAKTADTAKRLREIGIADPKDKDDMDAVDAIYGEILQQKGVTWEQAAAAVVMQYGVIPQEAEGNLRAMSMNGDPQARAEALTVIDLLHQQSPQSVRFQLGAAVVDEAMFFAQMRRQSGDDTGALAAITRRREIESDAAMKAVYDDRRREALKAKGPANAAFSFDRVRKVVDDQIFSPLDFAGVGGMKPITMDPAQRAMIESDWKTAFAHEYAINGGDKEMAAKAADRGLSSTYGVTRVTAPGFASEAFGGYVMPYPPELVYAHLGATKWLQEDFADSLVALKEQGHVPEHISLKDMHIVSDVDTMTQMGVGGPKSWALTYMDPETGEYHALDPQQLRWQPDPSVKVSEINAEKEAKIEAGRAVSPLLIRQKSLDDRRQERQQWGQGVALGMDPSIGNANANPKGLTDKAMIDAVGGPVDETPASDDQIEAFATAIGAQVLRGNNIPASGKDGYSGGVSGNGVIGIRLPNGSVLRSDAIFGAYVDQYLAKHKEKPPNADRQPEP